VPKFETFEFISPANGFAHVEVPIAVAGQVEGYVYSSSLNGDQPLGGARLKIRHNDASDTSEVKVSEDLLSYSTGEFFYLGLTPGKYRIYVDPKQLTLLELKSEPQYIDFQMQNKEEGDVVQNLNFILSPIPSASPRAAVRN
jgi:hypothetical protein